MIYGSQGSKFSKLPQVPNAYGTGHVPHLRTPSPFLWMKISPGHGELAKSIGIDTDEKGWQEKFQQKIRDEVGKKE